jgi:hypothetical protein
MLSGQCPHRVQIGKVKNNSTVAGGMEILYVWLLQPPARAGVLDCFSVSFFEWKVSRTLDWQVVAATLAKPAKRISKETPGGLALLVGRFFSH